MRSTHCGGGLFVSMVVCLCWGLETPGQEAVVPQVIVVEPVKAEAPSGNAGVFVGINEFPEDMENFESIDYAVNDALAMAYLTVVELKLIPPGNCSSAERGRDARSRSLVDLSRSRAERVGGGQAAEEQFVRVDSRDLSQAPEFRVAGGIAARSP